MAIDEIKDAIGRLSAEDRWELLDWLGEFNNDEWDREMERDFSADGRGAHLVEQVEREIAEGKDTCLLEGLRLRREQRAKG